MKAEDQAEDTKMNGGMRRTCEGRDILRLDLDLLRLLGVAYNSEHVQYRIAQQRRYRTLLITNIFLPKCETKCDMGFSPPKLLKSKNTCI